LSPDRRAVVVDTNVFGAPLARRNTALVQLYAPHLVRRLLVLAAQTVAELRFGALLARWGPARREELERRITRARVAPVDDDVTWEVARLRVACRRDGHALADDHHAADLWIAATAVRYGLALVAHDGVFRNAPGLDLVTEHEAGGRRPSPRGREVPTSPSWGVPHGHNGRLMWRQGGAAISGAVE